METLGTETVDMATLDMATVNFQNLHGIRAYNALVGGDAEKLKKANKAICAAIRHNGSKAKGLYEAVCKHGLSIYDKVLPHAREILSSAG